MDVEMSKPLSVFHDLEPPHIAAEMTLRADLMIEIEKVIRAHGWTQSVAAEKCGTTEPRITALLNGKINDFCVEDLARMTGYLGQVITLIVEERKQLSEG